jgi:hypothetical protein
MEMDVDVEVPFSFAGDMPRSHALKVLRAS